MHFKPELGLPKLVIEHEVRDEPKTSRRILLQLLGEKSGLGACRPEGKTLMGEGKTRP